MEGLTCPRCEGCGRSYWTKEKELRGVHPYDVDLDGVQWYICMECGLLFTEEGKTSTTVGEI